MTTPRPWIERIHDFLKDLRARGWNRIFIMRGNKLTPLGMTGPRMVGMKGENDNRVAWMREAGE